MFRGILLATALLLGGCSQYSRDVDRPLEDVATALDDLDIGDQPGSPGSDPKASGGVKPLFSHQRNAEGVTWTIMSGDDIAITMTAHLTPLDDGKRTRVTTSVARGNASDDYVSPAFRSEGTALALFSMAIESELDELTAGKAGTLADCEALMAQFERSNMASADLQENSGLRDGVGDVTAIATKLHAYDKEANRLGCNRFRKAGFGTSNTMAEDGHPSAIEDTLEANDDMPADWGEP